ncbi:MAG: YebC/PmpR family DNA-binding transcriptional regulator [Alphaproteobacteria bacterium]|nr:YebC/PmpR family DNA-binding transcriptional regulator [Alphaproteobacteria bacterium]MBR1480009.1 YebC/PmpR family DNA-binding transcriptional regulator [Alphaproteobacteria bacterium]
MSGHSQFHNIMYRKGAQDAKRAKMFAKIAREITVAAKLGGEDANSNPRLRAALVLARENNMPKDNIERAISKATTSADGANYENVRYEGYGPGGVAIIVETLTDNRNRTASDVRSAFTKMGGSLGETGSVAFSFNRVGHLVYETVPGGFEKAFEFAIECGADNAEEFDDCIEITSSVEAFAAVRDAFIKKFGDPSESGLIWVPTTYTSCSEDTKGTLMKLIDLLEDNDDVQNVFHNFQ